MAILALVTALTNPIASIFWNPVTGYMVAVIIALAWLFQPTEPPTVRTVREVISYPAAIIDVELPPAAGDSATTIRRLRIST